MTDELEHLRNALKSAPSKPDEDRKAADIASAMAAFDAEFSVVSQGKAAETRPSKSRPFWARLFDGGVSMIHAMTSRAGLAATSALVTAGLAMMIILPQDMAFGPGSQETLPELPVQSDENYDAAQADAELAPADLGAPAVEPTVTVEAAEESFGAVALQSPAPASPPVAKALARTASGLAAPNGAMLAEAPAQADARMRPRVLEDDTEAFSNEASSGVKAVADEPVSTFSIDVDTASWSILRSSLLSGHLPRPEMLRIEEMVNYFPYAYPAPDAEGIPFEPSVSLSETPWNPDTQLLHVALQGALPERDARPPLNLVFLIDTSGSMQDANKLPLLKQSLRLMLGELRPEDEVSIVTYAGSAGQVLPPTPAGERDKILAALDRLGAGGSTAGQAGLEQAYAVAESMAEDGEISRILLATDGDFNVGLDDPNALEDFIARKRESGAFLSVLGFGRGNLDDATMQALAQAGNGQAAYIDTIAEAQKVLVDQLTGQLFPIAQDVKVQIEFNPAEVAEYRLIGYETRALRREDFANDTVDAGEIGAGHQVTALYEVTPVGSPAILNEPLRYQTIATDASDAGELGFLRLRYKQPGGSESRLIELPIPSDVTNATVETRFASAIAGFGQLLRGSVYLGDWGYADAIALANASRGEDAYGYRAEAVRLMRLADTLAP